MATEQRGALAATLQPTDGTGQLRIGSDYGWAEVVAFAGPPWNQDGHTPVYWSYAADPLRGRSTLAVVAGPQVQLTRADILTTTLPHELFPEVTVLRAQVADRVPELDTALRADEVVGRPEWVINGYDPESIEYTVLQQFLATFTLAPDEYEALVQPRPNGVTIEHALQHWRVDIFVPWDAPAAFAWEIVHPAGFDPFAPLSYLFGGERFHIRLVCTSNVVVEGVTSWAVGDEAVSTLLFEEAIVALGDVPQQGSDLSRGYLLREVTDFESRLTPQSMQLVAAAEFAIGMIPIIGTAVDVAHVMYQAGTGRTLWGEHVTPSQVAANGAFALLGCVGDAADAAKILKPIAERLYPGVKLVSLNPGLVEHASEQIKEAVNAYVLEALERMTSIEYDGALRTLDDYTAGRKPLTELGTVLDEVVYSRAAESVASGALPDSVLVDSFSWIDPVNFDSFDDLPVPRQQTVIDAYRSVVAGAQPASYLLDRLEPGLLEPFNSRLDEWLAGRVLNVFFTGFRPKLLSEGFARYVSRGGHLNAVQWAATQVRGRYADALKLAIGNDFRQLLRRVDPELIWQVSKTAAKHYATLYDKPNFHTDLVAINRGFGLLFESDHGIEYRFFRGVPELEDFVIARDHVRSLLVPKNPSVARQLPVEQVFYSHTVKTAMLARLIPHGTEVFYTAQEVLDASIIVYIHWLKVPYPLFQALVLDVMIDASAELGLNLDLVIRTEAELFARNPHFLTRP